MATPEAVVIPALGASACSAHSEIDVLRLAHIMSERSLQLSSNSVSHPRQRTVVYIVDLAVVLSVASPMLSRRRSQAIFLEVRTDNFRAKTKAMMPTCVGQLAFAKWSCGGSGYAQRWVFPTESNAKKPNSRMVIKLKTPRTWFHSQLLSEMVLSLDQLPVGEKLTQHRIDFEFGFLTATLKICPEIEFSPPFHPKIFSEGLVTSAAKQHKDDQSPENGSTPPNGLVYVPLTLPQARQRRWAWLRVQLDRVLGRRSDRNLCLDAIIVPVESKSQPSPRIHT